MIDWDAWLLDSDQTTVPLKHWQQHIDLLARLFHSPTVFIAQHTHNGDQILVSSNSNNNPYPAGGLVPLSTHNFAQEVVNCRKELYIRDIRVEENRDSNPEYHRDGFISFLGLPLFWPGGLPFGSIVVLDQQVTDYHEPYFELIETFTTLFEADLKDYVNRCELQELTLTDELTGIYNRRGFDTLAIQKLNLAKRYGHTFGLMYFDLDNLGTINDQLGYQMGDTALITLADALTSELRESDIAARIGDDEFAALVFIRRGEDLENLAVRIQRKLNMLKQHRDALPPLTTSVGAKSYQADTNLDIKAMLTEVDRLMYNIKQQKRITQAPGHTPHH